MSRSRPRRPSLAAVVAAGVVLLLTCWALTTPAGGAPDERAHHIKAVAAARGDFRGRPSRIVLDPMRERELAPRSTRVFTLPAHVIDATFGCGRRHPGRAANCLHRGHARGAIDRSTYVATYPPFLYVPAGVIGRLSTDPIRSMLLERGLFALVAAVLLAGAAFALGGRGGHGFALIGLLAAATPMVLFLAASLNVSGLHIAATIGLTAALLAASRRGPVASATWWLAAASGAVAVLTRAEGVLWVVLVLAVYWLMQSVTRDGGGGASRPPVAALAVVGGAVVAVGAWQVTAGEGPGFGLSGAGGAVRDIAPHMAKLAQQLPGVFGWLDTPLPYAAYYGWYVGLVLLVGVAAFFATARQRVAMLVGLPVAAVAAVVFQSLLLGPEPLTGQLIQTRYVMPALLLVPLVAGEVLDRRFPRPSRWVLWPAVTGLALFNVGALVVHWRRNAVGVRGARWFFDAPRWSPPLGWWTWAAVAALAAVVLSAGAALSADASEATDR